MAEEKLYDEIFYNEQSKIEIKGDVVTETAKKIDKLIFEALQKHNRDLDSSSPRRRGKLLVPFCYTPTGQLVRNF